MKSLTRPSLDGTANEIQTVLKVIVKRTENVTLICDSFRVLMS